MAKIARRPPCGEVTPAGGSSKAPTYSKMRADATLKSRVREVTLSIRGERARKCSRIKACKVNKAKEERRDRGSLTADVQGFVVLGTNISMT